MACFSGSCFGESGRIAVAFAWQAHNSARKRFQSLTGFVIRARAREQAFPR